jgi:hypothetical protein
MSKGSMQKFSEENGRGRVTLKPAALPGKLLDPSESSYPERTSDRPARGTQVTGAGEALGLTPARSVRPSSREYLIA